LSGRIIPENLRYVSRTVHPERIVSRWLVFRFHWSCCLMVLFSFSGKRK